MERILERSVESFIETEFDMIITKELLDELSAQAEANHRLRQAMNLRNSSEDLSQRMFNALEPGTVMSFIDIKVLQ